MSPPPTATQDSNSSTARWFSAEVHVHEPQLKAYLRGSFPSVRDVDDVVQESYLRIWRAQLARPVASARAFLFQIARHLAIDLIRRDRARPFDSLRDLPAESVVEETRDAADALTYQEKVSLVAEALAKLPPRCREVFILRKFRQVPQREIAARLGISERTVESQVTRGMKLLAAELRRKGIDGFTRGEC